MEDKTGNEIYPLKGLHHTHERRNDKSWSTHKQSGYKIAILEIKKI